MSSNITHFPIIEEYLRVYPIAVDGKIHSASLYPLRQFRVLTDEIVSIIEKAIVKSNKVFGNNLENSLIAAQSLNHHVNVGLIQLASEGKIFTAEKFQRLITNPMNELFDNNGIVETCDGYTVFNPGHIPPTPSNRYQ